MLGKAIWFCVAMGIAPIALPAAENIPPVHSLPEPLAALLGGSIAKLKVTDVTRAGNLVQISLNDGSKDLYQLRLRSAQSVDEAAKIFGEIEAQIPSAPFDGMVPIGDQVRAWRALGRPDGGTILFRNGLVVAVVEGTAKWESLVQKAQILNENIGRSPAKFDLAIKGSNIPDVLQPSVQTAQAAATKVVVPATALMQKLSTVKDDKDRSKLILEIMNSGDRAAVPVLISQLDPKYPLLVRTQAMKALGKLGDPSAKAPLLAVLQRPVAGDIKDEDRSREPIERRSAISALEELGDPSVIPVLKQVAANPGEYPTVRERAESAIARLEEQRNK